MNAVDRDVAPAVSPVAPPTLQTLERRQRELMRAHRDILDDIVANAEVIGRIRAARRVRGAVRRAARVVEPNTTPSDPVVPGQTPVNTSEIEATEAG